MLAASTTGVTKTFPGEIRALDGIDFAARLGEVCAVVGANGSGKSTLLQILFGTLHPDTGQVRTLGVDPALHAHALAAQVGYAPQHPAVDAEMTGHETLSLFCTLYGLTRRQRRSRIEALATDFGLTALLSRRVSTYSGGFRQRLHLALSMVHTPRLLLLDEPTAGLDPEGRAFLWQAMRAYADLGHAVVVVTHDLEDVTHQCHQVALLSQGTVRLQGTPADIVADYGRVTWSVTLVNAPASWPSVAQQLASMAGVTYVDGHEKQLVLRLYEQTESETSMLAGLREAKLDVAAYRCERPNLSSAYFEVTGQHVVRTAAAPKRRQKGRGQ